GSACGSRCSRTAACRSPRCCRGPPSGRPPETSHAPFFTTKAQRTQRNTGMSSPSNTKGLFVAFVSSVVKNSSVVGDGAVGLLRGRPLVLVLRVGGDLGDHLLVDLDAEARA